MKNRQDLIDKKIIILDIDGTLVNSKKEITPKTKEALIDIQEKGHIVALASGRPYPGMVKYISELKLDYYGGYALAFNGGKVIDCSTKEVVFEKCIDKSYLPRIYDYALKNNLGMVTYRDDEVITGTNIDDYMAYEARLNYMPLTKLDNFVYAVDFDMPKCLLTANPEQAEKYELELKDILAPDLNVFRSEAYFIEVTRKGVDKAESIDNLLRIIGMKQEQSICCGDGFNDLTMVQYGGIGVAMDNAQQIVKDNADYITASCDDDGIVEVINKFVL